MTEPKGTISPLGMALLLGAIFVVAGCGIIYELLIGSTSSYFLGDSVEQFSITIGFFLFAMGIGSWLSQLVRQRLVERLIGFWNYSALLWGNYLCKLYYN